MKFEKYFLSNDIKDGLAKMGFKRPTDIQFKSIPHVLKGEDLLAIAQTGTGKTAAFAIPILDMLHRRKMKRRKDGIKCIVMVPTRELCIQIAEVFKSIGRSTKVVTHAVIGGVDQDPQIAKLEKGIDVLVATPGRLFDLVSQGHIKLHRVEMLVLDEADLMLDLGFIKDIRDLIRFLPKKRQTLFFSATINQKIKKLAYSLVNNPIRIQLSPKNPVSKNVEHLYVKIDMDDKRFFLERIVKENPKEKIIAFVRTKVRAERVTKAMARVGIEARFLHGDKDQSDRMKTLNAFRKDEFSLLIATDVSARGIDIPNVSYVVNYDLPEDPEYYVHRIGRTGRGKNRGTAYSFCSPHEEEQLQSIEEYLGDPISELHIEQDDYQEVKDFSKEKTLTMEDIESMVSDSTHKKKKKKKQ
jgi:ATP-dependent RNA helicase RhlE